MSDANDGAFGDAHAAASSGAASLLEMVLERIGLNAGARAVFGDPIERDGRTIIPVAQMIIGTGAGGGSNVNEGSGAGGGALTRPLGYIEVSGEAAAFVPLRRPWQDPTVVLAYTLLALIVSRSLLRLLRG